MPRKTSVLGLEHAKPQRQLAPKRTSAQLGLEWKKLVIGQDDAIDRMTPYINRYIAGLSVPDKPVANVFLLGPTGIGKTKTIEALCQVLHKSDKRMIRINCAEYAADHEISRMMGAPPGFIGHKENTALLNQAAINSCRSDTCDMAVILFDEIEKASKRLFSLLLGIMDTATLRLGDNTVTNFENCLIAFTSNVGSKEIMRLLEPNFGFEHKRGVSINQGLVEQIEKVGRSAFARIATPEFMNRMDEIIAYKPLTDDELLLITEMELHILQTHIDDSLGSKAFKLLYKPELVKFLTDRGTDIKFGARSVKRAINKHIYNPITNAFLDHAIEEGDDVKLYVRGEHVLFKVQPKKQIVQTEEELVSI